MSGRAWTHPKDGITPAWEFYTPDPYAEWAVYSRECAKSAALDDMRFRAEKLNAASGMRHGFGRPDHFSGRLAPERNRNAPPREQASLRACKGCGDWFRPDPWRGDLMHCTRACYRPAGRKRELPDLVPCKGCGVSFRPSWRGHAYHSRACAAPAGAPPQPDAALVRRCGEMYAAGEPRAAIAAALGVSEQTVKRWRKLAGVEARSAHRPLRGGIR